MSQSSALCYNSRVKTIGQPGGADDRLPRDAGQAMVEYVIVFAVLAVVVAALAGFFAAERRNAVRTVSLVTSEYP